MLWLLSKQTRRVPLLLEEGRGEVVSLSGLKEVSRWCGSCGSSWWWRPSPCCCSPSHWGSCFTRWEKMSDCAAAFVSLTIFFPRAAMAQALNKPPYTRERPPLAAMPMQKRSPMAVYPPSNSMLVRRCSLLNCSTNLLDLVTKLYN